VQVPSSHPQVPAPQSRGPSQLIVQIASSQSGAATRLMQLVGWQHWAGTQSPATTHPIAFMGVGAAAVVVAATGGITGVASGAGEVHPAVTSTAQQRSASERVRMSIQDDSAAE